jgi:FkbH-like protein
VWGDDPFALRRRLLDDPRLQVPRLTEEAATRTKLVKAQLNRQHLRAETVDESDYVASLQIECRFERVVAADRLERISELFHRTTQFNSNSRKFSVMELAALIGAPHARVFTIDVSDRFGDQGLVGAAVIDAGDIIGLVMSCRALGIGVEHTFMRHIIAAVAGDCVALSGAIVETARNIPVRHIFSDHGFARDAAGIWRLRLTDASSADGRAVA